MAGKRVHKVTKKACPGDFCHFKPSELEALASEHGESCPAVSVNDFLQTETETSCALPYKSIVVARTEFGIDSSKKNETKSSGAMRGTVSGEFRTKMNERNDGLAAAGAASTYYSEVHVCPACFIAYTTLNNAREKIQMRGGTMRTLAKRPVTSNLLPDNPEAFEQCVIEQARTIMWDEDIPGHEGAQLRVVC
jgi:hypothetical protein